MIRELTSPAHRFPDGRLVTWRQAGRSICRMALSPDLAAMVATVTPQLRELRRMQEGIAALTQQIQTLFDVEMADDWEDRYIAEGFTELEQFANR